MVAGLPILVVVGTLVGSLILPNNILHFREVIITFYSNGTMDFGVDVTGLVRSLGVVSLLTMFLGLTIGTALGLITSDFQLSATRTKGDVNEYETALVASGFVKITTAPNGASYQLTEIGRRFLRDYAFLNRGIENNEVAERQNVA
jgi:hypothetical protein